MTQRELSAHTQKKPPDRGFLAGPTPTTKDGFGPASILWHGLYRMSTKCWGVDKVMGIQDSCELFLPRYPRSYPLPHEKGVLHGGQEGDILVSAMVGLYWEVDGRG